MAKRRATEYWFAHYKVWEMKTKVVGQQNPHLPN
jgi:hypothetical protein